MLILGYGSIQMHGQTMVVVKSLLQLKNKGALSSVKEGNK